MSAVESPGGLPESETVRGLERDVVAWYREPYGPARVCDAAGLREVALEEFGPVSEPVPYRGRKGIITYWPLANGRTVICGSLRMWHIALALDFDEHIDAFSCEPLELRWRAGQRSMRWRPPFVARTRDGERQVLLLSFPAGAPSAVHTDRLRVLGEVAQAAGWQIRHVPDPSTFQTQNLRWLAGYRFPSPAAAGEREALLGAFGQPIGLRQGCAASGLPALAALDLAYRMIWQRRLHIDWQRLLLPDSLAWAG
ncbi:TnsA-like heteromeric transposase endonuclease subunit (plasmid) [Streptomyces sp. NBC_00536]|uniref:TnsA-like heteromeric transposase endonuclease subunit n=1 Tax=Streptomyces sp. NBC_00536 TaxID=2975769 RepID=UPI002E80975B|nr:TnsA-like heteromeric transposase endonuclease subunit [Streptomyces sp. NBC_00536]WUC76880.1 TnsA-like heteromeric transposase endonuclease subunit [Streptomyces sp. NBC_00536]WUC83517.1 TnsA-like heteromeric transposase endonuclease subunit [Streptomyces sp. NBC_00536]WUC84071.1 TnsA-like heteromeric transposase endonuclease subunit [Streptomyces sp. NBC_00536]